MNADTACADAIRNDNYTVECSGLCRTLITTALDTCPDVGNSNEYTYTVAKNILIDCLIIYMFNHIAIATYI